jgi:hypothetical protein
MNEGTNPGMLWVDRIGDVVPRRACDIFLRKAGPVIRRDKTDKERPVETGAPDGNPQRTRIPTVA